MVKKILCLVLALIMLALVACVDKTETDTSDVTSTSDVSKDSSVESEETSEETSVDEGYQPLLYKVEDGKGNVLYLLGSIHVGDARVDMLSDKIMNAYDASNYLCVECDIVSFSEDEEKMMSVMTKMLCPTGTTIKDQLGEETYNLCKKFLEDNNYYNSLYDYYGAYFWSALVSEVLVEKTTLSSDHGVDNMFLTMAHDEGMEIREVESVDFQYDMMLNFPTELWQLMIKSSIENVDVEVEALEDMYEAWISGDGKALIEVTETEIDDSEYTAEQLAMIEEYDRQMVDDRNNNMTDKAEEYLAGGGTGFFVVGAAHIVGEKGVAAQLRSRGYTVSVVCGNE